MTKTEKLVLKNLINSLNESTVTTWESGYMEEWSTWARKMRDTIKTSTSVLDALVSDENPEQSE